MALLLLLGGTSLAQTENNISYKTAAGLRLGYPYGVSVKHFANEKSAVEGILGFWYGGLNVTALYEYHQPLGKEPGLKWFAGAGAEFTSWNYGGYSGGVFGIDLIAGLDYKLPTAPLNLSLDWKPAFIVSGGAGGFYGGGGGLTARYTFR